MPPCNPITKQVLIKKALQTKTDMSWMATKDDVLKALHDQNTVLLDVRDKDEWIGTSSSPYGTMIA